MRNTFKIIIVLFLMLSLVACGEKSKLNKYMAEIVVPEVVSDNFTLPRMVSEDNDHFITWSSSNISSIRIGNLVNANDFGIYITQEESDVTVTLTATVELTSGEKASKQYQVVVSAIIYETNTELETELGKIDLGITSSIIANIDLPKHISSNDSLVLSWVSSNTTIVKVEEYAATNTKHNNYFLGKITRAATDTEVRLTVSVTHGPNSASRVINVTVLATTEVEYPLMATIAAAKEKGSKVADTTKIMIIGTVAYTTGSGYFVADSTGMMYVYGENHERVVGEEVEVKGVWSLYKNMPQLADGAIATVTGINDEFDIKDLATELTIAEISGFTVSTVDNVYCSKIVKSTFQIEAFPDGSYNAYKLVDASGNFVEVSKYNASATIEQISSLVSTEKFYQGYLIIYCSRGNDVWDVIVLENSIEEITINVTNAEKFNYAKYVIDDKWPSQKITNDLTLMSSIEKYNLSITWESNKIDIISNNGIYNAPENDTEVKLTATVKLGDIILGTIEKTIIAKGSAVSSNIGEHYKYEFASSSISNGTTSKDVTLGNLLWSFTQGGTGYVGWDATLGRRVQFGSAKNPSGKVTFETSDYDGLIENIAISTCGASGINAVLNVYIDGTLIGSKTVTTTTSTEFSFILENKVSGLIQIEITNEASTAIYFQFIEINK